MLLISPLAEKKNLTKVWGDITAKARGSLQSEPSAEAQHPAQSVEPASKKAKTDSVPVQPASKASSQGPASSASAAAVDPKEDAADPEFDLENPHDCQQLIRLHFGSSASKDLPAVAQFYVNELRQKATKWASLALLMQKELLKQGVLKSKSGRQAWFAAWSKNREARFAKMPEYLKSKPRTAGAQKIRFVSCCDRLHQKPGTK